MKSNFSSAGIKPLFIKNDKKNRLLKTIAKFFIIAISFIALYDFNPKIHYNTSEKTENSTFYGDYFFSSGDDSAEVSLPDIIKEELKDLDIKGLEDFVKYNVNSDLFDIKSFINSIVSGKPSFGYEGFLSYVSGLILSPIKTLAPTFISLIIIAFIIGILSDMSDDNGVNEILRLTASCFFSVIVLGIADIVFGIAESSLGSADELLGVSSPIILTLLIAGGGNLSASVYKPVVSVFSEIISSVSCGLLLPIIKAVFILNLSEAVSGDGKFCGIISFYNSLVKWILGLVFGIFSIFLSINGIAGVSYDGITLKATKYAVTNSVPIIGGYISGGMELIVYASVLIKNAVGLGTLVLIMIIIAVPLFKIAVITLLFKLTGGIICIISDKKLANFLGGIAKTLTLITVTMLSVGVAFFITIFLLITTASNVFV